MPQFICHYYNFYFAATAGGMMIGKAVKKKLELERDLEFYQYGDAGAGAGADVNAMLDGVREKLNAIAEGWSEEEKAVCLEETELSFRYSGKILRLITTA